MRNTDKVFSIQRNSLSIFIIMTLLCSAPMVLFSQLPSYLPTNGLVGYWPFNGNANDESGNGNHGTVFGASLTPDRHGNINQAFNFNGLDNRIAIGNVLQSIGQPGSAASINLWFKTDVTYISGPYNLDPVGTIISDYKRQGSCCEFNSLVSLFLIENPHRIQWNQRGAGTDYNRSDNTNYIDNTWHNIVLIIDGAGNQRVYIDGLLSINGIYNASANYADQTSPWEPDWQIGATHWNDGSNSFDYVNYFKGIVDDIAIYNRALTQEEITALYNGTTGVSGCTNATACNYNASATLDDGTCTFPAQTYLNCDGTCINDTDADGICNELETPTLPDYLPTNGLVGYWPFNGNANDESGNGNHGTVNGANLDDDKDGNPNSAFRFDGIDDWILCQSVQLVGEYTVQFWIDPDDNIQLTANYTQTNSGCTILSQGASNGPCNYSDFAFGYKVGDYGTGEQNCSGYSWFETEMGNGCSLNYISNCNAEMAMSPDWKLITISFSNSYLKRYINQALVDSIQFNGVVSNSGFPMSIGCRYVANCDGGGSCTWGHWKGKIDDIAIYNRALTQEEITALYTGTSSNNNGGGNGGTAGTPAASVPAGIPYQAVIRDNAGAALVNTPVSVRFTLHQNTTDGTIEFQETQSLTTNAMGLINTQIGTGTATLGTFTSINWSNTTKFIQVEVNTGNGFVDIGTQQLMSVPFAFQANKATAIKNAGLPVYADNAAALAGGLVAGEMYRTAAGVLMVVY